MGPSAIPNEIPVNTGYLMRICETLHSTPTIGRAVIIATTLSVYVCVFVHNMLLSSLVLYFDNAPSLILALFLCARSRGRPVGRTALAHPSGEPVAGQPPGSQPTATAHVAETSVSTSGSDSD